MRNVPLISRLEWRCSPREALLRWPSDRPMMLLHSGRLHSRWARWSIFGQPSVRYRFSGGSSLWVGTPPQFLDGVEFAHDPLRDLDALLAATQIERSAADAMLPFCGGWIGYISYDLGRVIEPRAQAVRGGDDDRGWPLIDLAWCPSGLIYDGEENAWWSISRGEQQGAIQLEPQIVFDSGVDVAIGRMQPCLSRERYIEIVQQSKAYIAAGDIYQANIAQRLTAECHGSMRQMACRAFDHARPWYGAYLEMPDENDLRGIISLSPELFLHVDAQSGRVTTRPIKGTRPSGSHANELHRSAKDAAELHMIIDLMRNDLGRVCEIGSVAVAAARIIETHPTVHHGVGEVVGRMRADVTAGELLRATFPGGSVTGAPKIRAMQIIDELEPVRRGPYCGAIGFFSDNGDIALNIAIRTMMLSGEFESDRFDRLRGIVDYSAGAGIVADSSPAAEYEETLQKSAVFEELVRSARIVNADVPTEMTGTPG